MRYQDWDVLVFPDLSKIPLQEFKTTCQVIQDTERHSLQNNPFLLPTVTCFIPGLPAGTAFRISIYSWQNPEISRYTQSLSKPSDVSIFEARLLVDGRVTGYKWFNNDGPWPSIIEFSSDLNKHGEFEKLKFPVFHKELLSQSYWNAGDDFGRIKVVIAEGFSREHLAYPFDRTKNIVSFSFQHAPIDVLESSSIAWPNAAMWRQASLLTPYFGQDSPRQNCDEFEAHAHSPHRGPPLAKAPPRISSVCSVVPAPAFPRQPISDPFTDPLQAGFKGWPQPRKPSSTDVSMQDYSNLDTRANCSRQVSDAIVLPGKERPENPFESLQSAGAFDSVCEALQPSIPADTLAGTAPVAGTRTSSALSGAEATNIEHGSFTITSIKSRKENIDNSSLHPEIKHATEGAIRKVAQPSLGFSSGTKRQRIVTPAASKVIDDEDEPRSSPSLRKASRGNIKQEGNDGEMRVLLEIENN